MIVRDTLAPMLGGAIGLVGLAILGTISLHLMQHGGPRAAAQGVEASVVDLSDQLQKVTITSASRADDTRYTALRNAADVLSNRELLSHYRSLWEVARSVKTARQDRQISAHEAQELATPMHAIWREIRERGLPIGDTLPDFDTAWTFLAADVPALPDRFTY